MLDQNTTADLFSTDSLKTDKSPHDLCEDRMQAVAEAVKQHGRKIKCIEFKNGEKRRFFFSGDLLCEFHTNSSRRGYPARSVTFKSDVKRFIFRPSQDDFKWNRINKFRRYANKAVFTNPFIEKCLALPTTREQWEADGKKELYDYRVTPGNGRAGECVGVKALSSLFPTLAKNIEDKTDYKAGRLPFRGLEASVQLKTDKDGAFWGWLSLEFKDCGNGHYYLLINDDTFIYTEAD